MSDIKLEVYTRKIHKHKLCLAYNTVTTKDSLSANTFYTLTCEKIFPLFSLRLYPVKTV